MDLIAFAVADIIKDIDGKAINSIGELVNSVNQKPIGSELKISISRNGKINNYGFILQEKKSGKSTRNSLEKFYAIYGIELDKNAATGEAIITHLSPMDAGYRSGLQKGDIIRSINGSPVSSIEDCVKLFEEFKYDISKIVIYRNTVQYTFRLAE